ncbi:MAG: hypothetical protein H0T58_11205 [Gemmatimonadales bacterium]|nr:hypothetical protein [Gemmatimonadales bacterium]
MRICPGLFLLAVATGCGRDQDTVHRDAPIGLAAAALRDTAFMWQTRETDHFRVHYQAESYAAGHIDQFVKDAEQARANGLQVLGVSDFEPRIDVFHLKSREQMKHLTDYPVRGWTDPEARSVLLVRSSDSNQGERHEIAHVLSHNLWGHSHDWLTTGWMSEALATYAGGPCSGYSIDEISAYLDRHGELIPLDSLAPKFGTYNDLVAYLQAGSFFGYLREEYGLARVRALWDQGFERLETTLKKSPGAIDAEWRTHLRELYPNPKVDWAPLKKDGCQ